MVKIEQSIFDQVEESQVLEQLAKVGKGSLDLAWILASIRNKKLYQSWNHHSFNAWLDEGVCNASIPEKNFMSKPYAYSLSDVGTIFYDYRDEIEKMFQNKKFGIGYLIEAARRVKNGADINLIIAHVLEGLEFPKEEKEDSQEKPIKVEAFVKNGDADMFQQTLILYAVFNGLSNTNESLNALVLSEYPELLNLVEQKFPSFQDKYLPLVEENKFYCQVCGNIPHQPTFHHIIPQSLAHGFGPQILLCWPCHENHVQPKWEHYCEKWLGEGSVETLKQEIFEIIKDGSKEKPKVGERECLIFPRSA